MTLSTAEKTVLFCLAWVITNAAVTWAFGQSQGGFYAQPFGGCVVVSGLDIYLMLYAIFFLPTGFVLLGLYGIGSFLDGLSNGDFRS